MSLIFDLSHPDKQGITLPPSDVSSSGDPDESLLRAADAGLPSVSEPETVRHFTRLSRNNFSIDANFYPLGSCTMKYNPKFTERIAAEPSFQNVHPFLPQLPGGEERAAGCLEVVCRLQELMCEITGMQAYTTQPLAGAHGELTGTMIMAAYHRQQGRQPHYVIIPDSCHGTNPASAAVAGYKVRTVKSDANGVMDFDAFKDALDEDVAGVMLTCPNTLGVFNHHIKDIADMTHEAGGLMYYDGANLNAIMGKVRPGDIGFDVVHLNLHKTFSTPHGGGGPGSGPVGVSAELVPFLPVPRIERNREGQPGLEDEYPHSIGPVAPFYGNFTVLLKACAYMLHLGRQGLIDTTESAVLNANYVLHHLKDVYNIPQKVGSLHEFVISADRQAEKGVQAIDLAKGLIEYGIHPPTVYFPTIVEESMMVEPTETESRAALDEFVRVMHELAEQAEQEPDVFASYPKSTTVSRPDETAAARSPDVCY